MAKQKINQGTAPTGVGGDTFRTGSAKLQANDDELYAQLGATAQGVLPAALPLNKGGTGATTAAAARTSLGLGTASTAPITISNKDVTVGRVHRVGDLGCGGFSPVIEKLDEVNNIVTNGTFRVALSGDEATNPINNHVVASFANHAGTYGFQLLAATADTSGRTLAFRKGGGSAGWSPLRKIRTEANTTVDANGFIKNASPVVQLFADRIELNDEAKLQAITFEKLATGDYLIKDSSGFAQTGWYIETPKDANGNVLFSVIYETLENGDISVKTYKKKFDLETASIVADLNDPVDITEGRWIDLRLQELPQTEVIDEPEQ